MSAHDRMSDGYEPRFDLDYERGAQGELYVTDLVAALASGSTSVETKTDDQIARTGNVYIEYACWRRGQWRASGIADTSADIWFFVLPANVAIAAPVAAVRDVARSQWATYQRECSRGSHPTKGVAVPLGKFVSLLYRYEVDGRAA